MRCAFIYLPRNVWRKFKRQTGVSGLVSYKSPKIFVCVQERFENFAIKQIHLAQFFFYLAGAEEIVCSENGNVRFLRQKIFTGDAGRSYRLFSLSLFRTHARAQTKNLLKKIKLRLRSRVP